MDYGYIAIQVRAECALCDAKKALESRRSGQAGYHSRQSRNYIQTIFIKFKRNVRPFVCSHSSDVHRDKKEQRAMNLSGWESVIIIKYMR